MNGCLVARGTQSAAQIPFSQQGDYRVKRCTYGVIPCFVVFLVESTLASKPLLARQYPQRGVPWARAKRGGGCVDA